MNNYFKGYTAALKDTGVFNIPAQLEKIKNDIYQKLYEPIYDYVYPEDNEDIDFEQVKDQVIDKKEFSFDVLDTIMQELNTIKTFVNKLDVVPNGTSYTELSEKLENVITGISSIISSSPLEFGWFDIGYREINDNLTDAIVTSKKIVMLFSQNPEFSIGDRVVYTTAQQTERLGTVRDFVPLVDKNEMGYWVDIDDFPTQVNILRQSKLRLATPEDEKNLPGKYKKW